MKIVNIEQGSDDWLAMRQNKITATDVSSILGINPFKDEVKLWRQKWDFLDPEPDNERMKRGRELEPEARQLLIESTGINYEPVVGIHNTEEWAMASLDGFACIYDKLEPVLKPEDEKVVNRTKYICEIKCPGIDTHELAIQGEVKPYYYSQMQWQLFVSGASVCTYVSYMLEHKTPIFTIGIMPDLEYIESMVTKCRLWWEQHIRDGIEPKGPEPLKLRK